MKGNETGDMDYPSSLVPAFLGYSTRLLRRCLLDSPIFGSGVIRAVLPRDAENERRPSRNARTVFIDLETFRNFKKSSRRATRVYFGGEHLGPRLASRDFNFARLAAARSSLAFFLLLIATTARPSRVLLLCVPFRHDTVTRSAAWFFFFFAGERQRLAIVFPCVSTPTERARHLG